MALASGAGALCDQSSVLKGTSSAQHVLPSMPVNRPALEGEKAALLGRCRFQGHRCVFIPAGILKCTSVQMFGAANGVVFAVAVSHAARMESQEPQLFLSPSPGFEFLFLPSPHCTASCDPLAGQRKGHLPVGCSVQAKAVGRPDRLSLVLLSLQKVH